jgi:hypothetical protein
VGAIRRYYLAVDDCRDTTLQVGLLFVTCRISCLFDQDIHWWMVVDMKVVDELLLPLVVNTPFTEMVREIAYLLV